MATLERYAVLEPIPFPAVSITSKLPFSIVQAAQLDSKELPCLLSTESVVVEMRMYLSIPKTDKVSEDGENDRLRFGASAMQGWRETMEDAHAALPDLDDSTSFFGVYDGHGGKAVAKFCATYLHEEVLKQEAYLTGDLVTSLSKAFLRGWRELAVLGDKISVPTPESAEAQSSALNDQLDQWSIEDGPHSNFDGSNSGSTACVAIIRDNLLVFADAGDSRCVLSRKGQAYPLSKDHKPDLAMERERIITSGGFVHAGRVNGSLNLSRAIGDVEFKRNKELPVEQQSVTAIPDVTSVEMCEDDEFLVIACDGIWDCMLSQQLVDYVRERLKHENKLSAVCEQVFERCLAPATGIEGCDNMTMILVEFKKHDSTASTETNPSSSAPSTEKAFTGNNPTSSSPSTEKAPTDKSYAGSKPEKASSGDKILSSEPLPEKDKPLFSDSSLEKASTGNKSDALTEKDKPQSSDSSPEKASTGNKSDASTEKGKPLLSDSLHEKASTGDKSDASTEKD